MITQVVCKYFKTHLAIRTLALYLATLGVSTHDSCHLLGLFNWPVCFGPFDLVVTSHVAFLSN